MAMGNTATFERIGIPVRDAKSPAESRVLVMPAMILFIALCGSVWLCMQPDDKGSQFGVAIKVTLLAGVGCTGVLFATYSALTRWRKAWEKRAEAREEQWYKAVLGMELQLSETRNGQDQVQKHIATLETEKTTLEYNNVQLRAELDQLKKAEKNLSHQRQALESSKTVLEIHVQARTKELQKLKGQYELILNSAGEGICGLDIEGKTIFANPAVATLTGWPMNELLGQSESEIFGGSKITSSEQVEEPQRGERIFTRKDGTSFPVEFVKTPISENGKAMGSVLVFKDITERKRVEEKISQKAAELARSNAELEQFAFVASHDLQEPLRKIQAFGDRLKMKCEGIMPTEGQDYLERMQSAAGRMRTLINDLLTFSRVIRSSEPFVAVNLGTIAKEILGDLEVRIEKCGAKVETGELATIEADPMQMRQLLLNLVSNALKFQLPNSQPVVKIKSRLFAAPSGMEMCELTVEDNGIGFEEKYLDKIFAVFQRLHGRNDYEGTGVGLAVCRRISDRHQGDITAKSSPGKGAIFIVTLPVHQPKPVVKA
jgi:PAS domain S-box-containing protein